MHIIVLSIHSSPLARLGGKEAGGMNVYVRELACELGQRGVQVDMFTRKQDPDLPDCVLVAPGVRLVHIPVGPVEPYDKNLILHHLDECLQSIVAFAHAQGIHYDVIHSHYFVSGAVALLLRQRWDIPIVQMFHTLGAMKNQVARSDEETETVQRIAIERQLLHEADAIVAATPIDREQMVTHYGADAGRIHVVPCGVDIEQFRPGSRTATRVRLGLPLNKHLLLAIGRMEPLKGFDTLIQAVALLREQQPDLYHAVQVLLIGGETANRRTHWNYEQRRLERLCEELNVTSSVSFLGGQPHNRLVDFYTAADAVVVPSHYESFGMVALEAMACGTPVIASAAGGLTCTIEDGISGLLVPPANAPALAEHLRQILTNSAQATALAHAARQRALEYGWDRIASQICELYEQMQSNYQPGLPANDK